MEELKVLMKAYKEEVGQAPELLGVALSSRKNLCIHPEVSECGVGGAGCDPCAGQQGGREAGGQQVPQSHGFFPEEEAPER